MSSITDLLAAILAAKKGEEVRGSIHDAIELCYQDGKAGVNDLQARQLIEAVAEVNEQQAAALEVLQARVEELENGEGGSSQQSTTIDIPTVLVDGGVVENVSVNNNSTKTQHVTFTTEFTETPKVMVAIGKNVGAVSQYGYLSANILYPTVTTTGFDFFLANRTGSDRSPGVVWYAYQPTVKTIDLDITIPETEGMTEAEVREITGPIAAAVDALKTGYDGTTYQTAAEAVRTQINDLHVLIGDEPGTAIDASAVGYNDSNVADELAGLNGRLTQVEASQKIKASEELKTILQNMMTLFSDVAMYKGDVDIPAIAEETNDLIDIIDIISLTLTGIDVVFVQGENVIYSDASLEDLKQYLTVTAHYDDGSSRQTTGYELSGIIATGTQTFTVTLGDFSDTFDAVITKAVIDYTRFITYQLPEETTFDGTSSINTGVKLGATDADFTIMLKGSLLTENWGKVICGYYAYSTQTGARSIGLATRTQAGGKKFYLGHNDASEMTEVIASSHLATPNEFAVAIIHSAGAATTRWVVYFNDWKCWDKTLSVTYRQETSASLFVGYDRTGGNFIGTIHDFTLYSTIVDNETITEYLEG